MAKIYAVVFVHHSYSERFYVGCTKDISKRWREHRCILRKGEHACASLQDDFTMFGECCFQMRLLEDLENASVAQKRDAELRWMRFFKYAGVLYNDRIISFQGPPGSLEKAQMMAHLKPGNRWTPEANLKRSLAQKGKPKGHGAKISATKQAKSMMR